MLIFRRRLYPSAKNGGPIPPKQDVGIDRGIEPLSIHLFYMINILERSKRIDDLAVGFILFQLGGGDGDGDAIYAESRIEVGGIGFDIVDAQAEAANGGDEILQVAFVFQFQVDFEVIGAVMQGALEDGEEGERAEHGEEKHERGAIKPRACRDAEQGAGK